MSKEIHIDICDNPNYLHIKTHGVWSKDTALDYLNLLVATITKARQVNVLVDSRDLKYDASVFSDYLATQEMELIQPPGSKRIAVVEKPEIKSNVEMFELALRNLGINARFFFDEKEALKWLEGDNFKNHKAI